MKEQRKGVFWIIIIVVCFRIIFYSAKRVILSLESGDDLRFTALLCNATGKDRTWADWGI